MADGFGQVTYKHPLNYQRAATNSVETMYGARTAL